MTLDKQTVRSIAAETQMALQDVATKYGLTVKVGGGRFDPEAGTYTPKVSFQSEDTAAIEWSRYAVEFGVKPEDFGRNITLQGRQFQLVGINVRAPKFPFLGESGGKVYKLTEAAVCTALGRPVSPMAWSHR